MSSGEPGDAGRPPAPVPASAVAPQARGPAAVPLQPEHLYKAVALLFLLAVGYRFFVSLTHVLLIAYAAAILAVALNVVVSVVPARRRWVAAGLGVLLFAAITAAVWFGTLALVEQARGLAAQGPVFQEKLLQWSEWIRNRTGLNIDLVGPRAREAFGRVFSGPGGDVLGRAQGLVEWLAVPLIVLFGGLFAVGKPNDRLLQPLLRAVPRERRPAFRRLFELLGIRLRGWVKGVLIAMLAVGTLTVASLSLLGVRYALLLGIINGLLEFIPLVGPWIGGILAIAVALLDSPEKAGFTLLIVVAIQQVESNLITPVVMSRAADVHPFVTLFSLLLFGSLFGFLGVLLALPLVILFWTLIEVLWVERAIDTDEDSIAPVVRE